MLQELLEQQRLQTNFFFESFKILELEKLIDHLAAATGVIFLTGVGKSGMIAKKVAVTMSSTGTKAFYMSPIDALHGDVGAVKAEDVVIIFSKSGESDELIELVPAIRAKGATVISILCTAGSRLQQMSDLSLLIPFQKELCPFDLAPTTSTTCQLMLGDLLTVALMKYKAFSLGEYMLNHPSGRIGRRLILKVSDIMLTGEKIPLCLQHDLIYDVLLELTDKRCGAVLVVDNDKKLLGIFTDGDLRRGLQTHQASLLKMSVAELMTKNVKCVPAELLAFEALKIMESSDSKRLSCLAVTDQQAKVVGLIHIHDIIQKGI